MSDESMSDQERLRGRAREALRAGRLPNARPDRTWGGMGTGVRCVLCDEPIKPDQAEIELQFANHGGETIPGERMSLREPEEPSPDKSQGASHHLHVRCFAAWEFERRRAHIAAEGRAEHHEP